MAVWLRETSFCTNIMVRSWPKSHREKLLSFLAEDRHWGPQFRPLQEVWMQNPSGPHLFFGFYSWKNHWHFQGHIIKWQSVYLRAIYWNDWLNSWLGLFCKQATATCTHKVKRHSLAAPAHSLKGSCDMKEELQNTAYVFPRQKEAENLKGNFLANSFFLKLGSELKYQADRYNCHPFGIHNGAFGSEMCFLQWTQLLSLEELINREWSVHLNATGKKNPEQKCCLSRVNAGFSAGGRTDMGIGRDTSHSPSHPHHPAELAGQEPGWVLFSPSCCSPPLHCSRSWTNPCRAASRWSPRASHCLGLVSERPLN